MEKQNNQHQKNQQNQGVRPKTIRTKQTQREPLRPNEIPRCNLSSWCQLLDIEFITNMILCVWLLRLDKMNKEEEEERKNEDVERGRRVGDF